MVRPNHRKREVDERVDNRLNGQTYGNRTSGTVRAGRRQVQGCIGQSEAQAASHPRDQKRNKTVQQGRRKLRCADQRSRRKRQPSGAKADDMGRDEQHRCGVSQ